MVRNAGACIDPQVATKSLLQHLAEGDVFGGEHEERCREAVRFCYRASARGAASSKPCRAVGARSAPLGQTTVPQTGSTLTRAK